MILIKNPPEVSIDVSIPFPAWTSEENDPVSIITGAIKQVFRYIPIDERVKRVDISVLLANDDLIRTLNREYREKDSPTNVLSFPSLDLDKPIFESELSALAIDASGTISLGDMVMSYETLKRECEKQIMPFDGHLSHLSVHSTLHLLGFSHYDDESADAMEEMEILIMSGLGYKNPYLWHDIEE